MTEINLGRLETGPHAALIRGMAGRCWSDAGIRALWVGGSLAAGAGDVWSDVDFRIAVAPGGVDGWMSPNWERYLPLRPCGGTLLRFGERALLHHMVLEDGTIVDFFVQDTAAENLEPQVVILACRDAAFGERLAGFARPAAAFVREIDGAAARQFLVDYWITTHKEMKALARKWDGSAFAGLYVERMALLRAWHMQATGRDIDGRVTIHLLGALHTGLEGRLSEHQRAIPGMPSRTSAETIAAIDAIRAEMARVGRHLAHSHAFAYPDELEEVVTRVWNDNKEALAKR